MEVCPENLRKGQLNGTPDGYSRWAYLRKENRVSSTLSGRSSLLKFLLCLLLYTPVGVEAFQDEEPVRSRIGIREYLLVGVYDNMTAPRSPGGRPPGFTPLRNRGLFPPGELPGLQQFVEVLPGHQQIRFQTRVGSIEIQKPAVMRLSEYLDTVRREQARRNLLANFEATQQTEEEIVPPVDSAKRRRQMRSVVR